MNERRHFFNTVGAVLVANGITIGLLLIAHLIASG